MKKPKYHNIRDAKGRFVKKNNLFTQSAIVPIVSNGKPAYRLTIDNESTIVDKDEWDEPTAPHSVLNKTKSALVWFSLGVLSGLIAWLAIEYYYHIFNPCR